MANDNRNEDQTQGRQSDFDQEKKDELGKSQQGATGQQGTIGGQQGQQSEFGQQGTGQQSSSNEPLGASHEQGAKGGSVTAAGGNSTGPGAGQAGIERGGGFVGSQGEDSGEYLQEKDPQQAGFEEQGHGAPEEGRDIERGGERNANRDTDIEGSSNR